MKTSQKRLDYLKEWKRKNSEHVRDYNRRYMRIYVKKHPEKFYIPKSSRNGVFYGTSGLGRKYELLALKLLHSSEDANKDNFHGKWDITWNGLKIDVKMRYLRESKAWGRCVLEYRFTTKKEPEADYYLLFCVQKLENGEDNVEKILFVPSSLFGKSGLSITTGVHKKTEKYRVEFSKGGLSNQI